MDRNELITKLLALDDDASLLLSERIPMIIIGGSALILGNHSKRSTQDIDVIDRYPELQSILENYDVNNRSNAFADCLAENFQDRLIKMDLQTKVIDYYLLSLEDLVIMKLYSDRPKDYDDITNSDTIANLDWDKLDGIIESGEADVSFNEKRYKRFLEKYEKYKSENKKWDK